MNSTGLKLTQADLIRNYVLMGLKPDIQTELYKSYWQPMGDIFLTKQIIAVSIHLYVII